MRFTKNVLMSIGAVALAIVLVNVIAPQAVHAAVAALVQVSNTATNPALTSRIDDPGRIPYQSVLIANTCGGQQICNFFFGTVPQGHRLVVQQLSGDLSSDAPTSFIGVDAGPTSFSHVTKLTVIPDSGTREGFFVQQVQFYVDAGQIPTVNTNTVGAIHFQGSQFISLTGYLLDCNAAPCAAIASF